MTHSRKEGGGADKATKNDDRRPRTSNYDTRGTVRGTTPDTDDDEE